jgi:hypothetical protein
MTFADYLEHITARIRKDLEKPIHEDIAEDLRLFRTKEHILELFNQAHLFNLGEAEDILVAAEELREDLRADLTQGVPAPFDNMIVMFQKDGRWSCEWHVRMKPYVEGLSHVEAARDLRLLVDLSEEANRETAFEYMLLYDLVPGEAGKGVGIQPYGNATQRAMRLHEVTREEAGRAILSGTMIALERVALISHPANYIVRTSPKLTPREDRRHRDRGETPPRKRPHYIVIDYETLVDLNPAGRGGSGHRSPVPHARRRHWRRLAERCHLARAEGRSRVWVKEAYVGEREFEDEKNRYVVLLDRKDGTLARS